MRETVDRRIGAAVFWTLLLSSLVILFGFFRDNPRFVDEWGHGEQIMRFTRGDWTLVDNMTTIPGYHALMAVPVKLLGIQSLAGLRFLSLLGGMASLFFFHLVVKQLWPGERWVRTVQFANLPVLFPYWFLIYTDMWCLTFVLLAVWLALIHRMTWSALAMLGAVAIRQPAIFWAGLIWLVGVVPLSLEMRCFSPGTIAARIKSSWMFAVVFVLFAGFVVWNGGVALHSRDMQSVAFNATNIWFFLITFGVLFFPDCGAGMRTVWKNFGASWRGRLATILGVVAVWILFCATYRLTHFFNRINLDYLLHNIVLYTIATQPWAQLAALGAITFGLAGWLFTPLVPEEWRWLRVVALASVVVLPYIDPRYYIVPFTLFLAFRHPQSRPVEIGLMVFFILCSVWIDVASFRGWIFP